MGDQVQTRIYVDGEDTGICLDSPIVQRPDELWDVVGQERLFEPAPEQMKGQGSFPWPDGFDD